MITLRFECGFHSREMQTADLPIEIRTPGMGVVKRVLSSQEVELDPGKYHILARLPAGQELHHEVMLHPGGGPEIVRLEPEPEARPPESMEVRHFLGSWLTTSALQGDEESESPLIPRWFRGNPLQGSCTPAQDMVVTGNPRNELTVSAGMSSAMTLYVQLSQPGEPPVNVALPLSPGKSCRVSFPKSPGGRFQVEIHLAHTTADLLASYLQHGLLAEAAVTVQSESLIADHLLHRSEQAVGTEQANREESPDPIAAAVSAYAILRLGRLEQLQDWTESLLNGFPWLPDGVVIRAEHLARLGEHVLALNVLLRLPKRGLPLFNDGLGYVLDRLALYADLRQGVLDPSEQARAWALLVQLRRFSMFGDFGQPYLTFTGRDPNSPDAEMKKMIPDRVRELADGHESLSIRTLVDEVERDLTESLPLSDADRIRIYQDTGEALKQYLVERLREAKVAPHGTAADRGEPARIFLDLSTLQIGSSTTPGEPLRGTTLPDHYLEGHRLSRWVENLDKMHPISDDLYDVVLLRILTAREVPEIREIYNKTGRTGKDPGTLLKDAFALLATLDRAKGLGDAVVRAAPMAYEVFDATRSLPPDALDNYIAAHPGIGDDPERRKIRDLVGRIRRAHPDTQVVDFTAEFGLELKPDLESRFQIRRDIDKGGLGIVYLAFDRQLGREVAIKQILSESDDGLVSPPTASRSCTRRSSPGSSNTRAYSRSTRSVSIASRGPITR